MDKSRVAAFTDAVVAIILTIMVLEFKTPETFNWEGILEEGPYLFAYAVSFIYISVAWYNHHYMFALAPRITKRIFWINNSWLFSMSLVPVSTAWVGEFISERAPEYFYLIIFFIWSITYMWLTSGIIKTASEMGENEVSNRISAMPIYRFLRSIWGYLIYVVVAIAIYFYPPMGIIITLIELLFMAYYTTDDSDQVA
ncbi:TMEM175 family protein [Lentilactobacillus kosonis]|uniref:Predicted integral membrane protein n=1 Tax=Lentilactobacillus kosonis TaxID=2810561 RepID=A0A401FIL0_9LACO|nr:TMEM175 family protein [Lentilactobacillus kosonis]GAY72220.1 predicted integral membrane protein [Lentilactobacillus kosonis]